MKKFKIVNLKVEENEIRLVVDFYYGYRTIKEIITEINEETEEPIEKEVEREIWETEREMLVIPAIMTKEQILRHLKQYWAEKYAWKDELVKMKEELNELVGYEE